MDNNGIIIKILKEKSDLCIQVAESSDIVGTTVFAAEMITAAYRRDAKIMFCGNGGSAADAQHLAAELSGRFYYNRRALYAEALHVNTSYLTAVANDLSFDEVFARQLEAKGRQGDVLVALSTSGNSKNILNAAMRARELGMNIISLTGKDGGELKALSDLNINIPSEDTARIQEMHITLGHSICQIVEHTLFPDGQ
jgi:D-sedoheptulose 7-phosphate isomerase